MNCDECREQILELIEAERIDPDSVQEVLQRCPDCRRLFDETKATLELVADLPLEEPSAVVDESVVGAARAHAAKVSPRTSKRFRPAPWAAAAVVLLAVGVGVWSIPETTAPRSEARELGVPLPDQSDGAGEQASAFVGRELTPADDRTVAARPTSKRSARPAPAVAERSSKPRVRGSTSVRHDAEVMKGLGDAALASERAAAPTSSRAGPPREESARSEACSRRLAEVEAEGRDVSAEDALELGRCYRDAGDFAEARRWLERATADTKTKKRATHILRSLPEP